MMKYFCLLTILFICSCKSNTYMNKDQIYSNDKIKSVIENCPEDGICTFEIFKNSQLITKSDEFGFLYPIIKDGNFTVLKYEYKRNEIPDTADSGYSEIIFIQLNPNFMEMKIENQELSKVNLLFGRFCFCKGQTGYYNIQNGFFSIEEKSKNLYQLHLNFKCDDVPQIITTIEKTFELK